MTSGSCLELPVLCTLLTVLLGACGTVETYPGPERADTEVAILEGYSRFYFVYWEDAYVSSVDGMRPKLPALWASSVKLSAGPHWIEVTKHSTIGGYSVCAFEMDFRAQHRYALVAHSMRTDVPYLAQPYGGPYTGSLSIEVSPAGSPPQNLTVATVCAPRGSTPQSCRQDADCVQHPDYHCRLVEDSGFGFCVSRDR